MLKFLFTFMVVILVSTDNFGQTWRSNNLSLCIESGISSSMSTETWATIGLGIGIGRHEVLAWYLLPIAHTMVGAWRGHYAQERVSFENFGLSHSFMIQQIGRWSISTQEVFQIQRRDYFVMTIVPPYLAEDTLPSYHRRQLGAGLGLGFAITPWLMLSQSVRYTVARGYFYRQSAFVRQWKSGLCVELSLGIRL